MKNRKIIENDVKDTLEQIVDEITVIINPQSKGFKICDWCGGSGSSNIPDALKGGFASLSSCKGMGAPPTIYFPCEKCNGTGRIKVKEFDSI